MVNTSLIRKVDKDSIEKIIFFSKHLTDNDTSFLKQEFDFNSNDIKHILFGYRNIGLVFNLNQKDTELNFDWSPFINRVILKNDIINRLDNVFINNSSNKLLLLTTKRLLKIDLEKLNNKIKLINEAIHRYNLKIKKEKREIEHELDFTRVI